MKKFPTLIYTFKIKISLFLFCLKINKNEKKEEENRRGAKRRKQNNFAY